MTPFKPPKPPPSWNPMLKQRVSFLCNLCTTFNLGCVSVSGCLITCIFITKRINFSSFILCNILVFLVFLNCISPYRWLCNDVASTFNIWLVMWLVTSFDNFNCYFQANIIWIAIFFHHLFFSLSSRLASLLAAMFLDPWGVCHKASILYVRVG